MAEQLLRYDPHGHSNISDGHESPEEVAQAAAGKLDLVGLSDHNTVLGIPRFLDRVKEINDQGIPLGGVPSTEITTRIGHMILAVPDLSQTTAFLTWARKQAFSCIDPAAVILPGVREFNGICIFTHPGVPFTEGITFSDLERLIYSLPLDVISNLAIEVYNNSATILPNYSRIQQKTRDWNKQFGLAEVAGTDSHSMYLVGTTYTLVPNNGKPLDLVEAIQKRNIQVPDLKVDIRNRLKILISHGSTFLNYRTNQNVYPTIKGLLQLLS